jgi:hypothetical protein
MAWCAGDWSICAADVGEFRVVISRQTLINELRAAIGADRRPHPAA